MNFDEMQVVWDAQEKRSLFAFDRGELKRVVDKQAAAVRFHLRSFEIVTIGGFLVVALLVAAEPFFEKHEYFQYYEAAGFLFFSGLMFWRARQRSKREVRFPETLLGEVDLAIWRLQSLISRMKEYTWLAVAPMLVMWLVRTVFDLAQKPLWLQIFWPTFLLAIPFLYRLAISNKHQPQLNNLEALKEKLRETENH